MPVKQIPFEEFQKVEQQIGGRKCNAIIRRCRREGILLNDHFYYQTPDGNCYVTDACNIDYIVEDQTSTTNYLEI